ncbi:MAG: hypothetical protein ABIT01_00810 [Thermoanaerobaculia bacterium]
MSHFACLVTGEDVDSQLAPFDENRKMPPTRVYLSDSEVRAVAEHYHLDPADLDAVAAKVEAWSGREGGRDDRGVSSNSTANPRAKWDWWEVGGRFSGFFTPKPGSGGVLGGTGTPDAFVRRHGEAAPEPRGVDEILKGDVDVAAMEAVAETEARKTWALYAAATAGTPVHTPWAAFVARVDAHELTIEEARERYHEQPRIAAFDASPLGQRFAASADGFPASEAAYVRRERQAAICPFAVLHEGAWRERGEMGWFGVVRDERATDAWMREVRQLWKQLPDDTRLAIVDCHI